MSEINRQNPLVKEFYLKLDNAIIYEVCAGSLLFVGSLLLLGVSVQFYSNMFTDVAATWVCIFQPMQVILCLIDLNITAELSDILEIKQIELCKNEMTSVKMALFCRRMNRQFVMSCLRLIPQFLACMVTYQVILKFIGIVISIPCFIKLILAIYKYGIVFNFQCHLKNELRPRGHLNTLLSHTSAVPYGSLLPGANEDPTGTNLPQTTEETYLRILETPC